MELEFNQFIISSNLFYESNNIIYYKFIINNQIKAILKDYIRLSRLWINNLLYGDNYANISNLTDENATPKSSLGKSLLEKIDAKYRNPKNYDNMDKHVCV